MYLILAYDINAKRVGKALKICRQYLHRVQNSVFEGYVSQAKLNKLKGELFKVIDTNYDSVRIYVLGSVKYTKLELIGKCITNNNII